MKKYYFIIFVILLFFPPVTKGAILYLEPSSGQFNQDDVFLVEVRLDTQGEIINAAEVHLNYPEDILEFKDFSKGNSILTLWAEEPEISGNIISFSGGIPGGYWGKDGLLGKFALQVRGTTQIATQNNAEIKFLEGSRVLLNDGLGTLAKLETRGVVFEILTGEGGRNLWQEEIDKDKILPEPFKIEISRDPAIFEEKYFITFSTTDKQTGIDRYEVKEGSGKWEIVVSPYVLKNQKLTSDIKVKAIDKAGNYWMETLKAPNKSEKRLVSYIILILILIVIEAGWILRNIKSKKKNAKQ